MVTLLYARKTGNKCLCMQNWMLIIVIGVAEFVWSYLADFARVKTVQRKKWQAVWYDIGALILTYSVLAVIAKHDWNWVMIGAAIVGAACGTFLVASRKPKRKVRVTRKIPFTTV